jgi:hypothetical protein
MEPKRAAAAGDRLSSLPVVLQDEILVRLDLRDAVRTSALSRAWRDLWKSLSVISLSFPLGTHPSVVDSVLLPYIGPRVSHFNICVDDASAGRIDDWRPSTCLANSQTISTSTPPSSPSVVSCPCGWYAATSHPSP